MEENNNQQNRIENNCNRETVARQTVNGMLWKFFEKIGAQIMQLVIQVVLARLLLPEEYGLVGLLTIFISISDVFILQGLTTALIQKKNADDTDFSSVFFANIFMSLILYGVLFALAPVIASFYNEPALTNITRVLSLNIIIGAFPAVHNAILSRELDFRKSFFRNIANVLTQGIVGITLACLSWGAWAMVFSKVSGTLIGAIVLWFTVKWAPKKTFDLRRVKSLFSYSSKVLGTNLLNTVFNNLHALIIGKYYSPTEVGYYQRGQQIPQTMMTSLDGSMTEVLYPAFSKAQNDLTFLKRAVRKSVNVSMFVVLPLLFGLLVVAKPLTLALLTEKWLPSVPFMQFSCIICMFWPLSHRMHVLNAIGKSDITFKLSLMGKGIIVISIFICLPLGIYALMIGTIIASFISMWVESLFIRKYIGYTVKEMVIDILPSFCLATFMGAIVFLISLVSLNVYVQLILQIVMGAAIYVAGAYIFKFEAFFFIWNYVKNLKTRKTSQIND